jgi:hypothetical protein
VPCDSLHAETSDSTAQRLNDPLWLPPGDVGSLGKEFRVLNFAAAFLAARPIRWRELRIPGYHVSWGNTFSVKARNEP